jgi:hypothetical protein
MHRITINSVPDDMHRDLVAAASAGGVSVSTWVRDAAIQRLERVAGNDPDPLATVSATLAEAKATVDAVRRGGQ